MLKERKTDKYEDWLVDLMVKDYQCSKKEANEYLEILYNSREGREHIKYVCEKYGTEKKQNHKIKIKGINIWIYQIFFVYLLEYKSYKCKR